ncbi:DUF481 domain-containing protein [Mucilaginibacter agri]|uniref:DUF481 domain-containing protein n=1 Tax=Mucilaginibacter agri TaxID=2695265 RepID=A0A965ZFN3_9SPHI|nr:DUF481 domain-containing protein [Mucilaginibacter agri]NCD70035.1 DUF481 domain-containing protein [Mucilaginibacter agri]
MLLKGKYIACIFILSFLFIADGFAQARKDTLIFLNNELLIGEFKQMSRGLVNFDSDGIGLISVKAYKLKSIHTTLGTLRVETVNRHWMYGTLVPAAEKDSIYLVDGANRTKLAWTDISSILPFRRHFFNQLDGKVSAGLSFSRSSGIGQFNVNGTVTHRTRSFQTDLTVSELGSIDSSRFSRDQENVQLGTNHYIGNSTWFEAGLLNYQRNIELSLAHRFQIMAGAGNKLISKQHFELMVTSGLSVNQERSIEGTTSGLLVELPVLVKLYYFKFKKPNMQIAMTNAGYVSLSESGRYRYDGNVSFSWELMSDFYFTTNLYGNYDSKPPDFGAANTDYGLVMGITYKF